MDEATRILVIGALSALGLGANLLVVQALFPNVVGRTRRAAEASPGRSFWLGFVNLLFLGAVGVGLSAIAENSGAEILQLPALVIYGLLALLLLLGVAAMARVVGARLFPGAGEFRSQLGGSLVLILGCLTPFLGWFLLFPYVGFVGVGAVILGRVRRPHSPEERENGQSG